MRLFGSIRRLLSRPMFGTVVIPRDARVDPARFPVDEFPVYCLGCDYELRGLPDPRCPECGKEFDRGKLLVGQYVRGRGRASWKQTWSWRVTKWSLIAAVSAKVLAFAVYWVAHILWGWPPPTVPTPGAVELAFWIPLIWLVLTGMGSLLLFLAVPAALISYFRHSRHKRLAVLRALEDRPNEHGSI